MALAPLPTNEVELLALLRSRRGTLTRQTSTIVMGAMAFYAFLDAVEKADPLGAPLREMRRPTYHGIPVEHDREAPHPWSVGDVREARDGEAIIMSSSDLAQAMETDRWYEDGRRVHFCYPV